MVFWCEKFAIEATLLALPIVWMDGSLDLCFHSIQLCKCFMEVRFEPISNLSRNTGQETVKKINNVKDESLAGSCQNNGPYGRQACDSNEGYKGLDFSSELHFRCW